MWDLKKVLLGVNGARKRAYGVLTWTCTQSQINYFAPMKQRGQSLQLAEHKELNVQM